MLEEQKRIYIDTANYIPDWKKQSKSDLIRNYVKAKRENNQLLINAYISAIICKYWGAITNYYRASKNGRVYTTDCYDWLTEAILTITNQPSLFEDEYLYFTYKSGETRVKKNAIYGKDNAPDIAMIKCISSMRAGFYQSANYDVRKLNYTADSLDGIVEDKKDCILPNNNTERDIDSIQYKDILVNLFNKKEYKKFFVVDAILNGDVFEVNKDTNCAEFKKKKLVKCLKHLNDNYCNIISKEFSLNKDILVEEANIISKYESTKLYNMVDKVLGELKDQFKNILKG